MRLAARGFALAVFGFAALVAALVLRPAPPPDPLQLRFDAAVLLLHAKRFDEAVLLWHEVLRAAPRLPEAHVNLGYALLGLGRHADARAAFERATTLRPGQANAYYGLALAWEAGGDLAMATGAMRSYLHLARGEAEPHLAKARAALWEWEQRRTPAR